MTLAELAKKATKFSGIGFSMGGLSNFENGKYQNTPRRDVVEALAFALGLEIEEKKSLFEAAGFVAALKSENLEESSLKTIIHAAERALKVASDPSDAETFVRQVTAFADRFARTVAAREDEVRVAIIPIAGWQAKALAPEIVVRSLEPALHEVENAGIRDVRLIVAPAWDSHWKRLKTAFPQLHIYPIEQEQPSGLSHALLKGLPAGHRGPVAVLLPDEVDTKGAALGTLLQMYRIVKKTIVGVSRLPTPENISYCGIAVLNRRDHDTSSPRLYKLETKLLEKPLRDESLPENSRKIAGRYILTAEIFDSMEFSGTELAAALNMSWESMFAYFFQETFLSLSPVKAILEGVKKAERSN